MGDRLQTVGDEQLVMGNRGLAAGSRKLATSGGQATTWLLSPVGSQETWGQNLKQIAELSVANLFGWPEINHKLHIFVEVQGSRQGNIFAL